MKRITPYSNLQEAMHALDNGGRFYNILTKADDGVIDKAELGKVGGLFNDKQQMILFFVMSTLTLKEEEKEEIISNLPSEYLFICYQQPI